MSLVISAHHKPLDSLCSNFGFGDLGETSAKILVDV